MGRGGGNWSELVSGISEGVLKLFCVVLQPAQSGGSLVLPLAAKVEEKRLTNNKISVYNLSKLTAKILYIYGSIKKKT